MSNIAREFMKSIVGLSSAGLMLGACSATPNAAPASPEVVPATATPASTCTVLATEHPVEAASVVPPITPEDYSTGPTDATVTIIEYCDFQAPICQSMAAVVSNVINDHVDDVQFVFRPVPLVGQLDKTELAVQAAVAAGNQAHFWEMYDAIFLKNDEWMDMPPERFADWLVQEATSAGLDSAQFAADLTSEATMAATGSLYEAARALGNLRMPFVVINGKPQPTFAIDHQSIASAIELILLSKRQFKECPPLIIDHARQYLATLHTEKGDIVIQLLPDKAPLAVNSFVFLARQGWFNDLTFHRVIPGFVAQTGDPSGSGQGNPGYYFNTEVNDLRFDRPGLVGMANSGPDTNGSQFFITFAPAAHLDAGFTIFGTVLKGLEIAEMLTPRDPEAAGNLPPGDRLLAVDIEER
jgi:cyclophilin family peptidyl-prolyl cis-trans isomerase/protein-disulfide isomerase